MTWYNNPPKRRKNKSYWERLWEKRENGEITEKEYDELYAKHEAELEKRRKYKRGEPIHTFDELLEVLDKDGLVWMFGRPKTSAFVVSQQFNTIIHLLNGGIFRAVKKDKENA